MAKKETGPVETPPAATFAVLIRYRRNSTWQGTVRWVEQKKEVNFRSALELIKLMDEAVSQTQVQE
ncbi:MAG: hypothetical protein VB021_01510 [Oscillospiraceae bacterium]|nr:hypothetical protein [Oscillospiraceae bacterium]